MLKNKIISVDTHITRANLYIPAAYKDAAKKIIKANFTRETIQDMSAQNISSYVQILALVTPANILTGEKLVSVEDRISFAHAMEAQMDATKTPESRALYITQAILTGNDYDLMWGKLDPSTYTAVNAQVKKISTDFAELKIDLEKKYLKAKHALGERGLKPLLTTHSPSGLERLDNNGGLDYYSFLNELGLLKTSAPSIYTYQKGQTVMLPDRSGYREFTYNYRSGDNACIQDKKGNQYFVPQSNLDKYNHHSMPENIWAKFSNELHWINNAWSVLFLALTRTGVSWTYFDQQFHLVLTPKAYIKDDPNQNASENHYGKDNKYYHVFRKKAGIISASDFGSLLTNDIFIMLHQKGFISSFRGNEYIVTDKIKNNSDPDHLQELLSPLDFSEKQIKKIAKKLNKYRDRYMKGLTIIDKNVLPELPTVSINRNGQIQLVDHHRIRAAKEFGLPIAVDFENGYVSLN